jgi:FtsZ-interacting cell division protein ZipA
MTATIITASIVIPALVVFALWVAKKEDEQIADITRRLKELEQGNKENN